MNPYAMVGSNLGTDDAASLRARLMAWHDAMVAHERRLKITDADICHDECPHAAAGLLWAEALTVLGAEANALTFLRSRAGRGAATTAARHNINFLKGELT
jgi:hypothetical protein